MSATKFAGLAFAVMAVFAVGSQVADAQTGQNKVIMSKKGALQPGMPRMKNGAYYTVYRFYGRQGHTYTIALASKQFDTFLWVQNDGKVDARRAIVLNDDHTGTDSLVRMRCTGSGNFYIVVTSYRGGETGNFGLAVGESR